MLLDIVFGSKAAFRILSILAEAPGQGVTKEEIKKITRLGGNPLFRTMNILLKNDIITSKKTGKKTYHKVNLANKYSQVIVNLIEMERRDLNNMNPAIVIILREYSRQLMDKINISNIYVFGSIVKGSYREDSDIDIAIITEKEISTKDRILVEKIGNKANQRFKREIQPHFFTEKEFELHEGVIEQIHRDGIRLV